MQPIIYIRDIKKWLLQVSEHPVKVSASVFFILLILLAGLSLPYFLSQSEEFYFQILIEAFGMLFDLAIIGILIFWLNKKGEERMRIRTYKDEIDDFRMWESEEAAFRTVGNIKRLNRHHIHAIDLVNCYMSKANLGHINLKNSNLNLANLTDSSLVEANLENTRMNQTNFRNSNLNQVMISGAYASGAVFENCYLIKSNFENAFLIKTDFNNALLMDANFRGSYLTGATFRNASLYKADFRGAKGLTLEQLAEAKTLYKAKLDTYLFDQIQLHLPELVGNGILKEAPSLVRKPSID